MFSKLKLMIKDKEKVECKGLYFRGYRSMFGNLNRFEERQGFRLLKKKSCPGCDKCGCIYEYFSEAVSYDSSVIDYPTEIEDGALYMLTVKNEYRDWETGYVEELDYEFVKVEDEKGLEI